MEVLREPWKCMWPPRLHCLDFILQLRSPSHWISRFLSPGRPHCCLRCPNGILSSPALSFLSHHLGDCHHALNKLYSSSEFCSSSSPFYRLKHKLSTAFTDCWWVLCVFPLQKYSPTPPKFPPSCQGWHFWTASPATLPQVQKAQWLLDQAEMKSAISPALCALSCTPTFALVFSLFPLCQFSFACLALGVAPGIFCSPLLSPRRKVHHSDPNLLLNANWQVAGVKEGWWPCRALPAGRELEYQLGTHSCSLKRSTTARILDAELSCYSLQSWHLLSVVWILMQRKFLRSHAHSRNQRVETVSHPFLNSCNVQIHAPKPILISSKMEEGAIARHIP